MTNADESSSSETVEIIGKLLGLAAFVSMLQLPTPAGLTPAAFRLAAVTVLMAILWLTNAVPMAVTSMIPLIAYPLLGIQDARTVSRSYVDETGFLFLGGFIISMGIEKWGLHRRIALHVVRVLGMGPRRIVLGFMLATGFMSMWISNTAATLMMLPIALSMLLSLEELVGSKFTGGVRHDGVRHFDSPLDRLAIALTLSIAYAANIGGFTTLVGTPTNVAFIKSWNASFPGGPAVSAGVWMLAVVPLGVVVLLGAWGILAFRLKPLPGTQELDRRFFSERLAALGPPSRAEWMMAAIFVSTALLWILRNPLQFGNEPVLPGWGDWVERHLASFRAAGGNGVAAPRPSPLVDDSTVAIGMALLMFVLPAGKTAENGTRFLMDWETAVRLPWGILLLFGGGFAIAEAFKSTGLSLSVGEWFANGVVGWPPWLLVFGVCLLMVFLTELTTNVATVSLFLPIFAAAAVNEKIGVDPRLLMIPATIATSCGFMLPIGTPPNAIVFGTGRMRMSHMIYHGLAINLLCAVLITAATFLFIVPQFDISLDGLPKWAGDGGAPLKRNE
jgi:sodium-dependent dicarboxylate transporter 2/3/5